MDVSNNGPVGPSGVNVRPGIRSVGQNYGAARGADAPREAGDHVELSERARILQKMDEGSGQVDEAREKMVAELKAAVSEGRYPLSPVEIAKALLASRRSDDPAR